MAAILFPQLMSVSVILTVASGPKGSSKDDSSFDYTPTANGDYTGQLPHLFWFDPKVDLEVKIFRFKSGPETLTIMRRSSSKRKSQRSAGAAAGTISELDDSTLERTVAMVDDDTPIESIAAQPSAEVCENASLRLVLIWFAPLELA